MTQPATRSDDRDRRTDGGFSLLEILVAVALIGLGLAAIDGRPFKALRQRRRVTAG